MQHRNQELAWGACYNYGAIKFNTYIGYKFTGHLCTMTLPLCCLQTSFTQDPVVVTSITESERKENCLGPFYVA